MPIILVKDGLACAEIVIGDNPDVTIRHAADELRHWVKEISDAELPIVAKPAAAEYKIRLTSDPEILQQHPQEAELLKDIDGYGLHADGKTLTIYGTMSKGPLNAVYRLLRKNTDIIWARPNPEYGTIFTKKKDVVFNVTFRNSMFAAGRSFSRARRMNSCGTYVTAPHGLPEEETPPPTVNGLVGASGRRHAMRTTSAVGLSIGKTIGKRIRNTIR